MPGISRRARLRLGVAPPQRADGVLSPARGGRASSGQQALLPSRSVSTVHIPADLLELYTNAPLLELGVAADRVRREKHPHGVVSYIVDRNINYTNVCVAD